MARECSICTHPDVDTIDQALREGAANSAVAALVSVDPRTIKRHRENCLPLPLTLRPRPVAEASDMLDIGQSVKDRLEGLLVRLEEITEDALTVDAKDKIRVYREARRVLEIIAKLTGEIRSDPTVAVQVNVSGYDMSKLSVEELATWRTLAEKAKREPQP